MKNNQSKSLKSYFAIVAGVAIVIAALIGGGLAYDNYLLTKPLTPEQVTKRIAHLPYAKCVANRLVAKPQVKGEEGHYTLKRLHSAESTCKDGGLGESKIELLEILTPKQGE